MELENKMYSLMIVDDEFMILRGMRKIIDWQSLDVEIVKEERSPLEALKYLKTHSVDILISDMNMDELAGTKFLPLVKKIQPDIQIIVLSGYNDFEYAKISLEQGVIDYLGKPVDPDELEEVIEKTKGIISRARRRKENSQIAKSIRIKDVLMGQNSLGELDVDTHEYYLVVVAEINAKLKAILVKHDHIIGTYFDKNDVYIIFEPNDLEIRLFANRLRTFNSTALISEKISEDEIPIVAAFLEQWLDWFHFYGLNYKVGSVQDFSYQKRPLDVVAMSHSLDFTDVSISHFRKRIEIDLKKLQEHCNTIEDAKYYGRLVLTKIYGSNQIMDVNVTDAIAKIEHVTSITEELKLLTNFYTTYRENEQIYPEPINSVVQIIKQDYQECLTLTQIAEKLHLSSVYLGALFKKQTGVSFAKFLNSYRISRSVELMRTTDKDITAIALEVGYQNPNYFFKVFKRQTHMVPSEYKHMIKKR